MTKDGVGGSSGRPLGSGVSRFELQGAGEPTEPRSKLSKLTSEYPLYLLNLKRWRAGGRAIANDASILLAQPQAYKHTFEAMYSNSV